MRRILITNDDGITSDGIVRLARCASKFGKVYVVAPDSQRSAMSHRITLRESIDVKKVDFPVDGVEAYASSGTPADCVRVGILNIMKEKPDVLLSGINFGFNSGTDIQYSATVGAALEGAFFDVHSIALSESFTEEHDITDAFLEQILEKYMDLKLEHNQIWNINFPKGKVCDCKGILEDRTVALNSFYKDSYEEEILKDGTIRFHVNGQYNEEAADGTDFKAIVDGYISVGVIHNLH